MSCIAVVYCSSDLWRNGAEAGEVFSCSRVFRPTATSLIAQVSREWARRTMHYETATHSALDNRLSFTDGDDRRTHNQCSPGGPERSGICRRTDGAGNDYRRIGRSFDGKDGDRRKLPGCDISEYAINQRSTADQSH